LPSQMSFLPTDWPSVVWGIVIGAVGAVFTGLFKKAGEYAWTAIRSRFKPPEPIRVANNFDPVVFEPGECAWVPETKVELRASEGFTFYPHPKRNAKCFRTVQTGHGPSNEYLMARPNAKRRGN
jgi:hypothetical protein